MSSPQHLLETLVRCPSVNPFVVDTAPEVTGEERMVNLLEERLAPVADHVERQEVAPGRHNLLARFDGADSSRSFAMEAHTDTVGVAGMEDDPFGAMIRDGRLHGRGACDTKGPMAAMLAALLGLREEGIRLPCTWWFCAICDEEMGGLGARHLAGSGFHCDGIIVGEPTGNQIVEAHKGAYRFDLKIEGRAAHSAYPENGINAVHAAAEFVRHLEECNAVARRDHGDHRLGPPTFSAGIISGGDQVNRIPSEASLQIDCRSLPEETEDDYRRIMEVGIERINSAYPGLICNLVSTQAYPGFATERSGPFADVLTRLETASGKSPGTARYTTDAGFYSAAGIPAVVFGPGDIAQAHTANEWIDLSELERGTLLFHELILES